MEREGERAREIIQLVRAREREGDREGERAREGSREIESDRDR